MTATTKNFGLEYLVPGEPVYTTRAVLQRNAESIDAALTRGGIAPPAAQDLTAVSGRVTAQETAPVGRWGRTAGQPMASGAFVPLAWDGGAEASTGTPMWSATQSNKSLVTIRRDGWYSLAAGFGYPSTAGRRVMEIWKNYTATGGGSALAGATAAGGFPDASAQTSDLARLVVGDTVTVLAYQDSGVSQNAQTLGWSQCYLAVAWLRPL